MKETAAKLKRLKRIERVRTVARHAATVRVAQAEGTLGQLLAIQSRTKAMAEAYDPSSGCFVGADLARMRSFVEGVSQIASETGKDVAAAQVNADDFQKELAKAERQRALVSERVAVAQKAFSGAKSEDLSPRRRGWHAS